MKRLLGLLLVMGMVGCGGGDEDPPAGEAALPATPKKLQTKVDEPPVQAAAADPNVASESGSPTTPSDTADDTSTQVADADAVAVLDKLGAKINKTLSSKDVARIAAQPHQTIVDIPQLVSAVCKPGMWQRTDQIVVQETSERKARTIQRKSFAKIKHVQGRYVVYEATDEKGFSVVTEIHSYDRMTKMMHSTSINSRGVVSRMIGVPDPKNHTVTWKSSNPNDDINRFELTLNCAKDGLSAQIQGKDYQNQNGALRWTLSGMIERVGGLPESDLTPAR